MGQDTIKSIYKPPASFGRKVGLEGVKAGKLGVYWVREARRTA